MDSLSLLSLLLILFGSFIFIQKLFSKSGRLPPPGPKPLPIIGNLLQLGVLPHQTLAQLSKTHGPLMTLKLGAVITIVGSSTETAKQILQKYDHVFCNRMVPDAQRATDHDKYSAGWVPVSPEWRLIRKIWALLVVSPKRLDAGQALRHEKMKQLRDYVFEMCKSGDSIDIGQAAFTTSLNFLSYTFFSLDLAQYQSESSQDYRNLILKVFEIAGSPNIADFYPVFQFIDPQSLRKQMEDTFRQLLDKLQQIINERLRLRALSQEHSFSNDVLDELLNFRQGNPDEMDNNYIAHFLLDVFMAGTDTSSRTIEWAMAELMHNPSKMAKAKAELEEVSGRNNFVQESDIQRLPYLHAVVKETFRLHPPAPLLLPRKAEADVEIDGYSVPKGSQTLVNVWAIGRDAETWTNPHSFEPDRFLDSEIDYKGHDFELLPFGAGRRMCPGMPLAHRNVHLTVANLLHSVDWKLENDMKPQDMNMEEKLGLSLYKAESLKLIPVMITTTSK